MKGLFYKDLIALKKEFQTFGVVTLGVIVVAVLFFLSIEYGNLSGSMQEMEQESGLSAEILQEALKMPIIFTLLIPMTFVLQSIECFRADEKAGFSKVLHSMPVAAKNVVGARYLTVLTFTGISLVGTIVAAIILSLATDKWKITEMLGFSVSYLAGVLLYMSVVMFLVYLSSLGAMERIHFSILIMTTIGVIVWFQSKLHSMPEEQLDAWMLEQMNHVMLFMQEKNWILLLVAILFMGISYMGSVMVYGRRKGEKA